MDIRYRLAAARIAAALLCALSIDAAASAFAAGGAIKCRVVGVHDGDTITCLVAGTRQEKIRLVEIDAPELRQPFGQKSKQALSALVFGKTVTVRAVDKDRYGRTLGQIGTTATADVNRALVRAGAAWCYRKYLRDQTCLADEATARERRLGLWAAPDLAVAPWDWRRAPASPVLTKAADKGSTTRAQPPAKGKPDCGAKRTCMEMRDCAEARFYLQCGVSTLDSDGDGTPCESLCR